MNEGGIYRDERKTCYAKFHFLASKSIESTPFCVSPNEEKSGFRIDLVEIGVWKERKR